MFIYRPILYLGLFFIFSCFVSVDVVADDSDLVRVRFATDWRAQAEQGGFYQAQALGLYAAEGLDVRIYGGGPGVNVAQLLGSGTIDFGIGSNSFIPLNMVRAGIGGRAVMAAFQKDPQILMTHPRRDIVNLGDMRGHPIMLSDASIGAFWVWLKAAYGFSDQQVRKYTFNLAPFLVDVRSIQQGYVTSEPYIVLRSGVSPQIFLLSDYGYPGYAAMVLARDDWIRDRPDIVRRFVRASIAGWRSYLYGDSAPGNRLIMEANPDMRPDILAFAISEMRSRNLVSSDSIGSDIGFMSESRWRSFFDIMSLHGVYSSGLDWRSAFTTQFLE